MVSFPLSLMLVPYAILVGIFLLYALFNVYHLVYYGATTRISFLFTFIFLAGTVIIFAVTWWELKDYEWARVVVLSAFDAGHAASTSPATNFGF